MAYGPVLNYFRIREYQGFLFLLYIVLGSFNTSKGNRFFIFIIND